MTLALALQTATAALVFCFALWAMLRPARRARAAAAPGQIALLFDGRDLVDATRPARDLMRAGNAALCDLDRFIDLLEPRFPDLRARLSELAENGRFSLGAVDGGPGQLSAEWRSGRVRVLLSGSEAASDLARNIRNEALRQEVAELRAIADESPQLMWREDRLGTIGWANRSYMDLAQSCLADGTESWPPLRIFPDLDAPPEGGTCVTSRHALMIPGKSDPEWFEITSQCQDGQVLHAAMNVTDQVRARDMQRDLTQTLTKTFAGLAVGLAVFDRNRHLVLFNPALSELTGISPSHLVARPPVDSFLDMLREKRVAPEIVDFAVWRNKLSDLAFGAGARDHVESWDLHDGRNFRMTCRPFPNGAIAVLIEDVSSDHALATQLQAALRLGQEALDGVKDAVAVFSDHGNLLLENDSCAALWGESGESTLEGELQRWKSQCLPSRKWGELQRRARAQDLGKSFAFHVQRSDGRQVQILARPTSLGGVTLTCHIEAVTPVDLTPVAELSRPGREAAHN